MAAQIGYCGLDRLRQPLTGSEIRGCWEAWPAGALRADAPLTIAPARQPDDPGHREFVEVGVAPVMEAVTATPATPATSAPPLPADPGWSLWGDPDR